MPLLWPASYIYRGLVFGWSRFGPAARGRASRLPAPVVSVGNIVVGGTGKTPAALWIARHLAARGKRPAILSRGYGGRAGRGPLVVCDGNVVLAGADRAGDEPAMLARMAKDLVIIAGSDRHSSGLFALEHLGVDCFVLDDGFQHLRLHRDLNLLLMDSSRPFGNGRLLPAGTLREPRSAVSRADMVMFTRWDQRTGGEEQRDEVARHVGQKNILTASHKYAGLVPVSGQIDREAGPTPGETAMLVSGIADGRSFGETVTRAGFSVRGHLSFGDHHSFSATDIAMVMSSARRLGAAVVLTTEKDAVRFPDSAGRFETPVYSVRIELVIEKGLVTLREALESLFN